jgi:urease subunit alpha
VPASISRQQYALVHGPTTGDRVRLGDTSLVIEIERDHAPYGDEVVYGWAKTNREGMMINPRVPADSELDAILVGAIVVDPVLGVFKGSIGIKDGRIAGIGNAGNPDIADDVELVIGPGTNVWPAGGMIATPGGIDSHVHFVSPRLIPAALDGGVTTLISAGLDQQPARNIELLLAAIEAFPVNVGLQARAATHVREPIEAYLAAGASGFKVHEDFGAYAPIIDTALTVADGADVAVCLHTDGLNEALEVGETLAAIGGRTIHAYHIEGSGGGHTPDVLAMVGQDNVIASSTTPTLPYGVGGVSEHLAMMTVMHGQNPGLAENVEAIRLRIRATSMAAETRLHDLGAISIVNSDSQGMGRIQETIRRTWQTADVNKRRLVDRGELAAGGHDNERVRQYLAKYTINPARTHGIAEHVGSLEPGKLADIVLWDPRFFGAKPDSVLKGGVVVWATRGDGNAVAKLSEPVTFGPMWGALGAATNRLAVHFVSGSALDARVARRLRSGRDLVAVRGCRGIGKRDLVLNAASPALQIDPETGAVAIDGQRLDFEPVRELALNRRYFLG